MPLTGTDRVAAVLAAAVALGATPEARAAPPIRLHVEVDPLPFVLGGYGGQVGVRPFADRGLRLAAASFALEVPDPVTELGGNEGFHLRVRPSAALYALYYLAPHAEGLALGAALRWLRLRYTHDDAPGEADVEALSPEVIAAWKWHPFDAGFYLQPWAGLSVTLYERGEPAVGGRAYDALPVQAFATVSLGWDFGRDASP